MDQKRSIAEKYSLDYYRRSLPTRSWRSPWNYSALVVALLLFGGMYVIDRNTAFQAAPVASVHSSFGTNCASCHEASWGAGRRLTTLSDSHPSVSDATCQACHPVGKHARIPLKEPTCAACHQEHRPERRLVDVADSACTRCHRDLASAAKSPVSFASEIRQFEAGDGAHPEFAVLRPVHDAVGSRHGARHIVAFHRSGNEAGKWLDRGGLKKFNHRLHLDPAGVLGPERKPVTLACADCHTSGSDGTMRPIVYEQLCSKCHPLHMVDPSQKTTQLPHSSVEEVRGVIRERLARQIEQDAQPPTETGQQRLPRLPVPARLTMDQEQQLAETLKDADLAVFGPEAKGMCRHCHYVEQRGDEWQVLFTPEMDSEQQTNASDSEPMEMVPSRWMPHARFDHVAHRAIDCNECHAARSSADTKDILMPSIAICRTCHGDGARSASMRVSADCVLCHTYHDEAHAAAFQGVPLDQLFPTGPQGD